MTDEGRVEVARALVAGGLICYVPANVLPVMTVSLTGEVERLTVLGGVQELYDSGLGPVAAVVFVASFLIPLAKLVCLSWILLLHGSEGWRRERTTALRILRLIGTWSMVDVFLLSVLVAVGQLGVLASVQSEPGVYFFAAMLLFTLIAGEVYEPRLIWKARKFCPA